jgi:hypothetical protein
MFGTGLWLILHLTPRGWHRIGQLGLFVLKKQALPQKTGVLKRGGLLGLWTIFLLGERNANATLQLLLV